MVRHTNNKVHIPSFPDLLHGQATAPILLPNIDLHVADECVKVWTKFFRKVVGCVEGGVQWAGQHRDTEKA